MIRFRKDRRKINRSFAGNAAIFTVLALMGAFMALPLVYAIVSAFKPLEEIFLFPPRFFVRRPSLENFAMMFQLTSNLWVPFTRYLFNSLFVSITVTFFHVILASMAAYPFAKHKFPGNVFIFRLIVLSLLFNGTVTNIPQYIIMSKLGLINSYAALLLPPLAASLGLFLMKQFMQQVPDSLLEAARIDGAGEFKAFWVIVMPSVKPAWLTLTIFAFQGIWNTQGLAFIYDESLKMLPTALKQIQTGGIARAGVGAAASLFLMIPPIITFLVTQSSVLETMAHSGIKD